MENIQGIARRRRGYVGWIVGGLVILLLIGLFAWPFFGGYYGMMGPYYSPHPFFGFFFFPFGFIFIFFLIFFVFRWLFFPWRRGYYRGHWYHGEDAEEILRVRYAKGEITKEQFDQMLRDLEQRK